MKSTTSIIRLACRDVAVLFLPALPFALLFGVMVVESGVPQLLGWSSSVIMFGGAAQMTLITLIGEGAAVSAAVTTTLLGDLGAAVPRTAGVVSVGGAVRAYRSGVCADPGQRPVR
jgi:predicted branched-subunit amino acid permease